MTPRTRDRERWTVGADALRSLACHGGVVHLPVGRLHAVGADGLVAGRSLCLAPVTLLDPVEWTWPDSGDEVGETLCWICLALTV